MTNEVSMSMFSGSGNLIKTFLKESGLDNTHKYAN